MTLTSSPSIPLQVIFSKYALAANGTVQLALYPAVCAVVSIDIFDRGEVALYRPMALKMPVISLEHC